MDVMGVIFVLILFLISIDGKSLVFFFRIAYFLVFLYPGKQ